MDVRDFILPGFSSKQPKPSPTSQSCRQHIPPITSVTNIDEAGSELSFLRDNGLDLVISDMIKMLYLLLIQPLLANPFGLDVGNINEALSHPAKVYPPWVSF